jgi:hypothetical protein
MRASLVIARCSAPSSLVLTLRCELIGHFCDSGTMVRVQISMLNYVYVRAVIHEIMPELCHSLAGLRAGVSPVQFSSRGSAGKRS